MLDAKHEYEVDMERAGWAPSPPIRDGSTAAAARRRAPRGRDGDAGRGPGRRRRHAAAAPRADPDEVTRTLASLADLRDRGAITAEEYEAKKADLLGAAVARPRDRRGRRAPATIRGTPVAKVPLGSSTRTSSPPRSSSRSCCSSGFPVHEFSHALAAYRLGDGTAKLFGRLTLNPIAHFDPVGGTLLALTFIGSAAAGGAFGFGWAKPTPVNPMNLEGGRRGEAIVAAAGPLSNLVLAAVAAIPLRFLIANPSWPTSCRLLVHVLVPLRPDQPRC